MNARVMDVMTADVVAVRVVAVRDRLTYPDESAAASGRRARLS
jgi:hypothetical protein